MCWISHYLGIVEMDHLLADQYSAAKSVVRKYFENLDKHLGWVAIVHVAGCVTIHPSVSVPCSQFPKALASKVGQILLRLTC